MNLFHLCFSPRMGCFRWNFAETLA